MQHPHPWRYSAIHPVGGHVSPGIYDANDVKVDHEYVVVKVERLRAELEKARAGNVVTVADAAAARSLLRRHGYGIEKRGRGADVDYVLYEVTVSGRANVTIDGYGVADTEQAALAEGIRRIVADCTDPDHHHDATSPLASA